MAISVVQEVTESAGWNDSITVTAGNAIVVIATGEKEDPGASPGPLTSSLDGAAAASATFESAVVGPVGTGTIVMASYLWNDVTGGTHTFSPSADAIQEADILMIEVASDAALEYEAHDGNDTDPAGTSHGASVTTAGGALLAAIATYNAGSGGATWDANFSHALDGSRDEGGSRVVGSGGTQTLAWSTGASLSPAQLLVAFREASADVTAPTIQSATINSAGTTLTLGFDEAVTRGAGHTDTDFTLQMSGGAATLTYSSGDGTSSLAFTISRTIGSAETGDVDYVQPTDGIEDSSGNDLASFTDQAVTNNAGSSSALLLLDS